MGLDQNEVEHIVWNYEQLREIVRLESDEGNKVKQRMRYVDTIMNQKLPELLKKAAPPNIYELMGDFRAEYEKFKDFILYDALIGKHIVGLGGGFSSGKSSFLNAMLGAEEILPENIDPSTSVPAYIVNGEENRVKAINIFDACMELDLEAINQIAHGFGKVGEEQGEGTDAVQLGHVLKNLFLETDLQKYEHLAFLDTPGYSKPESEHYTAKTDEAIARQQLNTADFILWFVPSDAGSLTEGDIGFLKSMHQEIPITVIISKANRRAGQQEEIKAKIKEQILAENLNVKEIFCFDKETPEGLDRKRIDALFEEWNQEKQEKQEFAKRFKRLFWECREYYKRKKEEAGTEIRNLQNALLILENAEEAAVYIERVKASSEQEREKMTAAEEEILRLQTDFFREIKVVGDEVGIYMPEPEDIEVLGDKITNPLQVLKDYNKAHKKNISREQKEKLLDIFREIKPVFECEPGGSKYKEVIQEVMKKVQFPQAEEISFGREIDYQKMMEKILDGTKNKNKQLNTGGKENG